MSREDEKASKNPLLVIADERSGSRYARAVGGKGLPSGYVPAYPPLASETEAKQKNSFEAITELSDRAG